MEACVRTHTHRGRNCRGDPAPAAVQASDARMLHACCACVVSPATTAPCNRCTRVLMLIVRAQSVVGGVGGGYYNYGAPAGYTQVTSGWPGQSVSQPTHRGQYAQMGAGAYAGYSMQGGTYSGYQMQGGMQRQQMMMYHGRPVMNQQQVHHPVPQQKQLQGNQYAQQRASTQTQQIPNHQPPTKYFTQQRLNLQTQVPPDSVAYLVKCYILY